MLIRKIYAGLTLMVFGLFATPLRAADPATEKETTTDKGYAPPINNNSDTSAPANDAPVFDTDTATPKPAATHPKKRRKPSVFTEGSGAPSTTNHPVGTTQPPNIGVPDATGGAIDKTTNRP